MTEELCANDSFVMSPRKMPIDITAEVMATVIEVLSNITFRDSLL
jgi:hypothetical protein